MPVISEDSIFTEILDVKIYNLVHFCPYDKLSETVDLFLENPSLVDESNISIIKCWSGR